MGARNRAGVAAVTAALVVTGIVCVVGLPAAGPAWAQPEPVTVEPALVEPATVEPAPAAPAPVWEAGLAGGVASVERYAGSSRRAVYFAAAPYLVFRGPRLRISGSSARLVLAETPRFWLDVSVGGWLPVHAGNDPVRAGMPDLDLTFQAGPRVNYLVLATPRSDTVLRLTARAVWSAAALDDISHRGYVLEPAVRVSLLPGGRGGRFSLGTSLSALLGDSELNAYFYDVPPAYATPERPAFHAGAGPISYALSLNASWKITRSVKVGVYTRVQSLAGTVVSDSPLVQDERSYALGLGANWVFWRSERKVQVLVPAAAEE
jgi:outer membrane protein